MLLVLLRLKPIIRNGRKLTVPGPYGKVGSPRLTMSRIAIKKKPYADSHKYFVVNNPLTT